MEPQTSPSTTNPPNDGDDGDDGSATGKAQGHGGEPEQPRTTLRNWRVEASKARRRQNEHEDTITRTIAKMMGALDNDDDGDDGGGRGDGGSYDDEDNNDNDTMTRTIR